MCSYKKDPDNGLAIVFKNETCREVGPKSIIL
jgi:hypothetical protein